MSTAHPPQSGPAPTAGQSSARTTEGSAGAPGWGPPGPEAGGREVPPNGGGYPPNRELDGFFGGLRRCGMVRPIPRGGAGVCAAVAGRLGVHPLVVRILTVVLALAGGAGLLAYGVGWLLLPEADGRIHAEELLRRGSISAGLVGAGALIFLGMPTFGVLGLSGDQLVGQPGVMGFLVLIGLAALLLATRQRSVGTQHVAQVPLAQYPAVRDEAGLYTAVDPTVSLTKPVASAVDPTVSLTKPVVPYAGSYVAPPAPVVAKVPRRRPAGPVMVAVTAGLALVAAAAVVIGTRLGGLDPEGGVLMWGALAVAAVIGCALVVAGLMGRRAGGLLGLSLALVSLGTPLTAISITQDYYARNPQVAHAVQSAVEEAVNEIGSDRGGNSVFDLSALAVPAAGAQPVTLTFTGTIEDAVVRVPSDLLVELDVTRDLGDIEVRAPDGTVTFSTQDQPLTDNKVAHSFGPAGEPAVRLVGRVGLGDLTVVQVQR